MPAVAGPEVLARLPPEVRDSAAVWLAAQRGN